MKTQIFGTFGPACSSKEILKEMIGAGMTGMRLNLSHTSLQNSQSYIGAYEEAAIQIGVKPQILIDMQGPELRVGDLEKPIELEEGCRLLFRGKTNRSVQEREETYTASVPVPAEVIAEAELGDEILLDDGKILVQVVEDEAILPGKRCLVAKVLRGGVLHSHKSVKIVGKNVAMPPLTPHDVENIQQAKTYGVTALMQPFVLCGEDLRYVRNKLKENGAQDIQIFAKIENKLGAENLEDILPEADVIIIARGDLGNDMPLWELPKIQKQIEDTCKKEGKPYIVVTQMLASMEENPVPTRAEVSDIFHAVYHGAWGVMVTGETAVGKYPVDAIRYLANTSGEAEKLVAVQAKI